MRPRVVGRIAALRGGFLVYCDAYVFGVVIRLLVHSASVRIVRVGYPCVIGFPVGTDSTRNARFALDVTPFVIGRIVTFHSGFLVVCQSDVCFSCGIIADSVSLGIIRIAYPCVIGLPILSRCTGNTVGAIDPVRTISSRFS